MLSIVFGLATGLAFGSHDFFGGIAARRTSPLAVVAMFKFVAVISLLLTAPVTAGVVTTSALVWGSIAGVAIGLGNIAYFRALAIGRMGVVSTIVAIWSALVPLVAGLAVGERPSPVVWAGIGAIVVSIGLITYVPTSTETALPESSETADALANGGNSMNPPRSGIVEAIVGGVLFGMFFVTLSQASGSSSAMIWPLLSATAVAALLVGVAATIRRVEWRPALAQWPPIMAAGVLYAAANWMYILGVSDGWVSIVAVLAALSPLPTIVFARLILCEVLGRWQIVGVMVALAGVALITLGVTS